MSNLFISHSSSDNALASELGQRLAQQCALVRFGSDLYNSLKSLVTRP